MHLKVEVEMLGVETIGQHDLIATGGAKGKGVTTEKGVHGQQEGSHFSSWFAVERHRLNRQSGMVDTGLECFLCMGRLRDEERYCMARCSHCTQQSCFRNLYRCGEKDLGKMMESAGISARSRMGRTESSFPAAH